MDKNQDGSEVLETPEEQIEATEKELQEEQLTPEQIKELKEKAARTDELESKNKQLFERAKKVQQKSSDDISSKDVLYLAKADIHTDDVDEVLAYSKKMGVSIADAHKFYTPILAQRTEERKSATVSHTGKSAATISKTTPEDTLQKAERGEILETDADMQNIFKARIARRFPDRK